MAATSVDNCIKYSNPDEKELSMVFNFHHLKVDYKNGDKWTMMDFDFKMLKDIFKEWQEGMQEGNGWSAVFWCNHDQPRVISRFGNDKKYHNESGKMLATTIHMMRGTPYIYQGEEFGMTNPYFDTIEEYRDVESINYYNILKEQGESEADILEILRSKSRDNSRTPIQWNSEENAGFTTGTPWIPVAKSYKEINAENALKDDNSIFYHYKKLISLRKEYDVISKGNFNMILEDNNKVLGYTRNYENKTLVVLNNFYGEEAKVDIPSQLLENNNVKVLISNYSNEVKLNKEMTLRPYESIVYYIEK